MFFILAPLKLGKMPDELNHYHAICMLNPESSTMTYLVEAMGSKPGSFALICVHPVLFAQFYLLMNAIIRVDDNNP
jgi:hypothetical protein